MAPIALALLLAAACAERRQVPSAVDGALDLRSWSFESDGPVQLLGDWDFCWGQMLAPGEPPADPPACRTLHVPGLWAEEGGLPGSGVATYRLRVLLPEAHPGLALYAGAPLTAHRLWVDGRPHPGTGRVAPHAEGYVSKLENRTHVLAQAGDELELLVQVANFDFRSGGLRRRWILGAQDDVRNWVTSATVRDTTLATVNTLVGLFFLSLFAFRPQDRTRLYFGLAGIALGLRVVPGNYSDIGQLIAPGLLFPTALRLEYFANNFVVFAAMGYFEHRVPRDMPRRVARCVQAGAVAGMLGALFLPLSLEQIPMRSAWILGAVMLSTSLYALVAAARRGEPNVRITLAAVPLCLVVVLWDSFRAEGALASSFALGPNTMLWMVLTESQALFPMSMLLMVLNEAMVLMRTFSRSYATIETLSRNLTASNEDLRETNRAVERFVPFDFLRLLGKASIREVARGDSVETDMVILFCDIRSFTPLVEAMPPDGAFRFVNAFTEWMEPAIHGHGGFINQYLGDCIMALFPTGADEAVRAGLEMLESLDGFNEAERERGELRGPIQIGIGINTGPLMMGTIGGPERLEHGVIGDAVNIASRVESLNKLYGTSFLISASTHDGLAEPSAYALRELDRVVVKGRSEPIPIFEVLAGSGTEVGEGKRATLALFGEARRAYAKRAFEVAERLFGECLARCPGDAAAEYFEARCRRLCVEGVPVDWNGETVLTDK